MVYLTFGGSKFPFLLKHFMMIMFLAPKEFKPMKIICFSFRKCLKIYIFTNGKENLH